MFLKMASGKLYSLLYSYFNIGSLLLCSAQKQVPFNSAELSVLVFFSSLEYLFKKSLKEMPNGKSPKLWEDRAAYQHAEILQSP